MPSLSEVQAGFAAALLDPAAPVPPGIVGPDRGPAPRRFAVYRNNVVSALANAVTGSFPAVKRIVGERLDDMTRRLRSHGLAAVTAIRLVPAAPFAVEGIIAGAVRIKLWHYTLGTFLGMLPGVLATSIFGTQITAALEDFSTINWWIVGAVIVAFAAFTYFVRRWFAQQG